MEFNLSLNMEEMALLTDALYAYSNILEEKAKIKVLEGKIPKNELRQETILGEIFQRVNGEFQNRLKEEM